MNRFLGSRGASAVAGLLLMLGSGEAVAQTAGVPSVTQAVASTAVDTTQKALGTAQDVAEAAAKLPDAAAATASAAVATVTGTIMQAQPARTVTVSLAPEIAKEAAWLQKNGWPLYALVDRYSAGAPLDEQANCIAQAVYHEARGESLEGQLAVARVIMNRAASGKYPATWCGAVKQPWQFSFVNPKTGHIPYIDQASNSWRKAVAITRLAVSNAVPTLSTDVLWYHADYVAPSWGRRLTRVEKIGAHIFYS